MYPKSHLLAALSALALGTAAGISQADAQDTQFQESCRLLALETDVAILEQVAADLQNPCRAVALARLLDLGPIPAAGQPPLIDNPH